MSANKCLSNDKSNTNNSNDSTSLEDLSTFNLKNSSSNIEKEKSKKIQTSKSYIKEVYEDNLIEEIKKISILVEEDDYNFVGMDTEFPGTVFNSKNYSKQNFYYETLKININSLKLIQLGITLRNKKGEYPSKYPYYIWQFNFKFDIENDIFSQKSIKLLKNAGINFEKLKKNGITHKIFASYLMTSGLVLNPEVRWICFQGSYDFGYLLRLLLNEPLPDNENEFIKLLNLYFPNYYDIRMIAKDKCCLQGSLNKLAKRLKINRDNGDAHQAGSDSYITIGIFYKLIKCGIVTKELMKEKKNILYGIGLGEDNEMIIKYMKKEFDENNNKNDNYSCGDNNCIYNNNNNLDSYNYENNNHMSNNCLLYSNIKGINYSLINMNYYGINYFNSNFFYFDNIKNIPNMMLNTKLSII